MGVIAAMIGAVARSRGMAGVARATGLSRESLYRSIGAGGNPTLVTVLRVLDALGLRLTVAGRSTAARARHALPPSPQREGDRPATAG